MTGLEINRRTTIFGGLVGLTTMGGLEILVASRDSAGLFKSVLQRLLGTFNMPDAHFEAFAKDYANSGRAMPSDLEVGVLRSVELAGATAMAQAIAEPIAAKLGIFERSLMTAFVFATGFRSEDRTTPLTYLGLFETRPCANPFAKFAN